MLLRAAPLRAERNRKLRSQISGWPSPGNWSGVGAVDLALRFCSLRAPVLAIEVQVSSWPSPGYRSDVGAVGLSGAVELSCTSWAMKIQVSSWPPVKWCRRRWGQSARRSLKVAARELVSVPLELQREATSQAGRQ